MERRDGEVVMETRGWKGVMRKKKKKSPGVVLGGVGGEKTVLLGQVASEELAWP